MSLSKPDATVILMDLVRLKTSERLTRKYTKAIERLSQEWLGAFYEDFCESMRAAWTPNEFKSVLPKSTYRRWEVLVQKLLSNDSNIGQMSPKMAAHCEFAVLAMAR